MPFMRPESRALLWRWREVLLALALALWGLWLGLTALGLVAWFGWGMLVIGAALLWAGVQRARFRIGAGGVGMVQVDEREVIYFGPLEGGSVSIEAITSVHLSPAQTGAHRWLLAQPGRAALAIPINADQNEQLFDAFEALPGFEMQNALAQLHILPDHPVLIWQRGLRALH
ncbi:MAG: hypothetical protein CSA68_00070 [Rhodobacterales bacterium]|nr:MAG: hypothetical protein CSA68_00070 [Rhodobacterales bacterium]